MIGQPTLELVSTLAVIVTCVVMLWSTLVGQRVPPPAQRPPSLSVPKQPIPLEGAATKGTWSARVAVLEYSDFQCPYCVRFARDTLPALVSSYVDSGKVLFAFKHRPLEAIHPLAVTAASATVCAGKQGLFWEMHDALFRAPKLTSEMIRAQAEAIGARAKDLDDCLKSQVDDQVRAEGVEAETLGFRGTPTFVIGQLTTDKTLIASTVVSGARSLVEFSKTLDAEIARARK